jgi:transcriptional regulator with XRE-family HTH domain
MGIHLPVTVTTSMQPRPERIRRSRILAGYTQAEVATKAGIASGTYHRIETGQTRGSLKSLHAIANALGVEFEYIVDIEAA